MLDPQFFDWWFAPWEYAANMDDEDEAAADDVALRDAYRWWCKDHDVVADLPQQFDPAWQIAAIESGEELVATARLFAGLMVARRADAKLDGLKLAERKWCLSIAATQPLRTLRALPYEVGEGIEVRGLVELSLRLDQGFAGMWDRLRLTLPVDLADRVEELRQLPSPDEEIAERSPVRAQRCWRMCRERVVAEE